MSNSCKSATPQKSGGCPSQENGGKKTPEPEALDESKNECERYAEFGSFEANTERYEYTLNNSQWTYNMQQDTALGTIQADQDTIQTLETFTLDDKKASPSLENASLEETRHKIETMSELQLPTNSAQKYLENNNFDGPEEER